MPNIALPNGMEVARKKWFTLTGNLIDPTGELVELTWNFGDGKDAILTENAAVDYRYK